MGRIVAVFNQKGGVGKTTTVVNLAAALGAKGKKVLVIDMDPQGNSSSAFAKKNDEAASTYEWLIGAASAEEVICETEKNVHLIPSNADLAGLEIELAGRERREHLLRDRMESLPEYHTILLDCPPSLGLLSLNALAAADGVLIPIQCEYYALEGVGQLVRTLAGVQREVNPELAIEGVVMTMFDKRNNLALDVVDEVKRHFGKELYRTAIPRNIRLAEAPSYGSSVLVYDSQSKGAEAYRSLANEFIKRRKNG